ncbi:MAG: hypothetical protein OXC46_00845 [Thaumarchaeota archaeon]|nr:hypothetical protein [Nitrososphaerota archaeon]
MDNNLIVAENNYRYEFNELTNMINDIEKDETEIISQLKEVLKAREDVYNAQGDAAEKLESGLL